jgi:hypothetical protein
MCGEANLQRKKTMNSHNYFVRSDGRLSAAIELWRRTRARARSCGCVWERTHVNRGREAIRATCRSAPRARRCGRGDPCSRAWAGARRRRVVAWSRSSRGDEVSSTSPRTLRSGLPPIDASSRRHERAMGHFKNAQLRVLKSSCVIFSYLLGHRRIQVFIMLDAA